MSEPARVQRSARPPVTRERIAEAALRILDDATDESALTMRTLAAELGVQAPSLYAHVTGIDEIVHLVHERINTTIDLTCLEDPDPREGLRRFAQAYRDAYRRHRVAATIIVTRSVNADHALVVYEAAAACLTRAGVPAARVMPCLALLDAITLGSAIEPFAAGFVSGEADYRPAYPALAGALGTARRRTIDDDGFALGLEAFLDTVKGLSTSGPHEVIVRPAIPADLGTAGDICVAAYQAAGQLEPGSPYVVDLRDAATRAADGLVLVAELDGRIVGTVSICPPGSTYREIGRDDEVEFRFLAVAPDAWGSGVARALVAACEDAARRDGAAALAICVRDTNVGAAAMYGRMGFERVPDRDWTPRPGIDLLALRRAVPHHEG